MKYTNLKYTFIYSCVSQTPSMYSTLPLLQNVLRKFALFCVSLSHSMLLRYSHMFLCASLGNSFLLLGRHYTNRPYICLSPFFYLIPWLSIFQTLHVTLPMYLQKSHILLLGSFLFGGWEIFINDAKKKD